MNNKITAWLPADAICTELQAEDKLQIFEELTYFMEKTGRVTDRKQLLADMELREKRSSTAILDTVIFPHAKSSGVSGLCASIGIKRHNQIYVMISWPENTLYCLKRLGGLLETMKESGITKTFRTARNAAEIYSCLNSHLAKLGIDN